MAAQFIVRITLGLILGWAAVGMARAQTGLTPVNQPAPTHQFGQSVTFEATFANADILKANLLVRASYLKSTVVGVAQIIPGAVDTQVRYTLDTRLQPLVAFAPLNYWWEITTRAGQTLTTERQTWVYSDNRFDWRALSQDSITVNWYAGDDDLARRVLDAAFNGLTRAQRDFPTVLTDPIQIYVYANAENAQAVFYGRQVEWAAAQALSQLNLMYVVVNPASADGLADVPRLVPHEVMHLVLGHFTGHNDDRLPLWLNEGLASLNQELPNANTAQILQQARTTNTWLPLSQLCQYFPSEPYQASLAYAQSESLVRYLTGRYGVSAIKRLITAYIDGVTCEAGLQRELGLTLAELERDWLRANGYAAPPNAAPGNTDWWVWAVLAVGTLSLPGLFLLSVRWGRGNTM